QQCSRQQSSSKTSPEDHRAHPALLFMLSQQRQRDQISGDHKEHIHPSGYLVHPDMEDRHQQGSKRPQPFDIAAKRTACCPCALVVLIHVYPSSLSASEK